MKERGELSETKEGFKINLRNCSGVPVLEFIGELNRTGLAALERTLSALADAGHYHVVLNLQRAMAANARALACLGGVVKRIRNHYGSVDLITDDGQTQKLLSHDGLARLFRFCTSEAQALCRIKRLQRSPGPRPAGAEGTTARMAERK